jgi:hypothetical protein
MHGLALLFHLSTKEDPEDAEMAVGIIMRFLQAYRA